jgi:FKBP-type peptidyl-prolyl cis-trans isomerase
MTRKTLTGLLLAATTLTVGTLTVVHAQDGDQTAQEQQQRADLEAAIAAALGQAQEKHDHDHSPTTVHSGDKAFELDDETAYPDPDGFASMFDRASYAFGRGDAMRIPSVEEELNIETLTQGVSKGLSEENDDFAIGFQQGYQIARSLADQSAEEIDIEAFIQGLTTALKQKDSDQGIGYIIGNSYRMSEIELKTDKYIKGIQEALAVQAASVPVEGEEGEEGEEGVDKPEPPKTLLTQEQVQETIGAFDAYMMEKQKQAVIKEGTDYINSLKEEDGWKKTESGIAYRVIEEGKGDGPDFNDIATMDYELKLLDGDKPGSVLQSSFEVPQTVPFSAQQVIKGWGEILQLMNPGATFETVIPYNLGYGERGDPPAIPPYATLIFKMKMHSFEVVENKPEPKPAVPLPEPEPAE